MGQDDYYRGGFLKGRELKKKSEGGACFAAYDNYSCLTAQ